MDTNPALTALGLPADARAVILHADDVGMCQATIPAAVDLLERGTISSASIMVPCPWAEAAALALTGTGADLGVHWTLTSEWPLYRWTSLTGAADLHEDEGRHFPRTCEEMQRRARPASVFAELCAQLELAQRLFTVSHVDAHMGAIATPALLPGAIDLALSRGVVAFLPRWDTAGWRAQGLDEAASDAMAAFVCHLESQGVPLVDHVRSMPLDHDDDHRGLLLATLDELPSGITHLYCHPAVDTPELRAACPDWAARVENHAALSSPGLLQEFDRRGVTLLRYSALQAVMGR